MPLGTHQLVTVKVRADMLKSGMDEEEAEKKSKEIAQQKHDDTVKALQLGAAMLLIAWIADYKGAPTWASLGFAGVGIFWAGCRGDKEYADAFVSRFTDAITKVRKAFGLGGS